MLVNMPLVISAIPRLIAVPLVLLICSLFFLPRHFNGRPAFNAIQLYGQNATEVGSTFSDTVHNFWKDLASALVEAEPQCEPLQVMGGAIGPAADFRPVANVHVQVPDRLVGFTEKDEMALLRAHYLMRTSAKYLASSLPFRKGTTGIVTTANARYMPVFLVSLRMLRKTGCNLPVEVFIDDWSKYDAAICDTFLPPLNARCIVLSNIYDTAEYVKQPVHFQYKILAILFSSFQHILFLDSDAFPAHDPSVLFTTAPYTTHGLVTWPDYWALTVSEHFYHIAAIPEERSQSRYSTESGQLLINKHTHRESLLMMVYYNYYGPDYYYILLSQGSHGAGDKETFVPAALAVGQPYYQVRTGPVPLGRFQNGTFRGVGIAQADPTVDYAYLPPAQSHLHPDSRWTEADLASDFDTNHTGRTLRKPRPLFLHQNFLKPDPALVLDDKKQPLFEPDGSPHRMWGSEQEMLDMLGYDAERRLWSVILEEACKTDPASDVCVDIGLHIDRVFG